MAIDWDGNPDGLFRRAGKIIKYINAYLATASTTYPADLLAIVDLYEAADMTDQVLGLYADYASWQSAIVGIRERLASYIDATLSDKETVLDELGLLTSDLSIVFPALFDRMIADSETINRSTVTLGTPTAAAGNVGTGKLLVTKLLDGVTPPLSGGLAHLGYAGLNSELAVNETMRFACVADSYRDRSTAGAETFTWEGGPRQERLGYGTPGSGAGPSVRVAHADDGSLLTNGDFETWSDVMTPGTWVVTGVDFSQETTIKMRGSYSAKVEAGGTPVLEQDLAAAGRMVARRCYCLSAWARSGAASGSAGTIVIEPVGTGWTVPAGYKISQPFNALPATWTLLSVFFVTPSALPSDLGIRLTLPPTGDDLYIDEVKLLEVPYHGGVGAVLVAGDVDFVVGDSFTVTVSNNNAGVIQKFSRDWYGFQWPSAASPTIADSLAT